MTHLKHRGFTVIELLVVVAIMSLLMLSFMFRYRNYGQVIIADQLANEVALTLREAQFYATGVRELAPGTQNFGGWYGARFTNNTQNYTFFADLNQDYNYDAGEERKQYTTKGRINITGYSFYGGSDQSYPLTALDIVFEKNVLQPVIFQSSPGSSSTTRAMITTSSPDLSVQRAVCLETGGRIYITRTLSCPPAN